MWFLIFFVILLLLILYVLLIPIVVSINTEQNQYEIQLHGLAKASILKHEEELLQIKLKVLGFCFYFYPLRETLRQAQGDKKKKEIKKTKVKVHKKRSKRFGFRKMVKILRTFKIKRVLLDIDTGDDIQNAKLYPIFGFMNHYIGTFNINFEGRNQLILQMHNRPINIIKSFINK